MTTFRITADEAKATTGVKSAPQKGGKYHFYLNYVPVEQDVDLANPSMQLKLDDLSLRRLHDPAHMKAPKGAEAAMGRYAQRRPLQRGRRWGYAFEVRKQGARLSRPTLKRQAAPIAMASMKQGRAAPKRVQELANARALQFKKARDMTLRTQMKPAPSTAMDKLLEARQRMRPDMVRNYGALRRVANVATAMAPTPVKPIFALASRALTAAPRPAARMAPKPAPRMAARPVAEPMAPRPAMRPRRRLLTPGMAA